MFSTVTELLLPQDFSPTSGFRTLKKQSSSKGTAIQRLSNRERNLDMSHFISKQFHENLKTSNSLSQYVTNLSPLQTATYSSQTSHSLLRRTVEYSRYEYLPFLLTSLAIFSALFNILWSWAATSQMQLKKVGKNVQIHKDAVLRNYAAALSRTNREHDRWLYL